MSDDRLTETLAVQVMGWTVGPERYMLGGRRWIPRWRFRPMARIEDAVRLLERAAAQEHTTGAAEKGEFWARVRVRGVVGEARDRSQARAITLAVARALGIEVGL